MRPSVRRPLRIIDLMVLVAATAVAFAIYRRGVQPGLAFTTFGTNFEAQVFVWMHQFTMFPAMWSIAVLAIDRFDSRKRRRRVVRDAGVIACGAATVVIAISSLISSSFYLVHLLEDFQAIPRVLSHPRSMHLLPPFGEAPLEMFVGAAVVGAWAALALARRWRAEPSGIDRLGRVLGLSWIGLLILYIYGLTG
jgi:hypothetical protein